MKKNSLVFGLAITLIVIAMIGGTWKVTYAAGTVAPIQPTKAAVSPTTAPTETSKDASITDPTKPVDVSLGVVGINIPANTLPKGTEVNVKVVDPSNESAIHASSVFAEVTVNGTGKFKVYFNLSQSQIDDYMKNPNSGILYWDPAKKAWTRLTATLENGVLSVEVDHGGLYTCGYIK
jgi:hypothetical protein